VTPTRGETKETTDLFSETVDWEIPSGNGNLDSRASTIEPDNSRFRPTGMWHVRLQCHPHDFVLHHGLWEVGGEKNQKAVIKTDEDDSPPPRIHELVLVWESNVIFEVPSRLFRLNHKYILCVDQSFKRTLCGTTELAVLEIRVAS
jgi:hypothetical protein